MYVLERSGVEVSRGVSISSGNSVRVLFHVIVHYPGLSKIFSVAKLSQTNFEAKKDSFRV